jgi:hypothetical protein
MEKEIFNFILENNFLFRLTISLLVLFFGWFLAKVFAKGINKFFEKSRLNQFLKRIGVEGALEKIFPGLSSAKIISQLGRWFFVVVVLMIFAEILGLSQFSQFLQNKIIGVFYNIFIAYLIFIAAAFLSELSQRILIGTFEKEKIVYSRALGRGISIGIWILASLAILYQLQIASPLILILFAGVVAFFALSLAIAFGFGAKDLAAKFFKDLQEKLK